MDAENQNSFPYKLYEMLEFATCSPSLSNSAVSWNRDGRSFVIADPVEFMQRVAPKYFKLTMFRSFVSEK